HPRICPRHVRWRAHLPGGTGRPAPLYRRGGGDMSFFTGLMETLCGYALAWGANVAVFTVFLCLTGRFWQRNAAPALRRAGYLVAIYIAFLPQFYKVALPLLSM